MENQLAVLRHEVLKLTTLEREELAQVLLASLHADEGIDEAWAIETERRIAQIDSGAVKCLPIEAAIAQVRAALK